MTDPHRHTLSEHGHEGHLDAHDHAHGDTHAHSHARAPSHGGHAHRTPPAAVPAASMRWSVLSLSVPRRVLLVAPMVACLWLAVGWAITS